MSAPKPNGSKAAAPRCLAFYVRVSRESQDHDSQLLACREFCRRHGWRVPPSSRIYAEKISRKEERRTQLDRLLQACRGGLVDTLLVYDQTRIGGSAAYQLNLFKEWDRLKIRILGVADGLDTFDQSARDARERGYGAVDSEYERSRIAERTRAGLKAARAAGRVGGRPRSKDAKIKRAFALKGTKSVRGIAREVKLSAAYVSMLFSGRRRKVAA